LPLGAGRICPAPDGRIVIAIAGECAADTNAIDRARSLGALAAGLAVGVERAGVSVKRAGKLSPTLSRADFQLKAGVKLFG
jgi:hypothetical protein